jgi:hemerythrin-like domain-containing protein
LAIHSKLDEYFLAHQELLLERRLPEAARSLARYVQLLELHMRHEEALFLPIYTRETPPRRWPLVLYTGQHQRMRELLASASERLERLVGSDSVRGRDIIELLDHERTYKHLAEHHDGAEREGFFPALDRLATREEQTSLVERCWTEWLAAERSLDEALTKW